MYEPSNGILLKLGHRFYLLLEVKYFYYYYYCSIWHISDVRVTITRAKKNKKRKGEVKKVKTQAAGRYTLKLLSETCVQRRTRPVSRSVVTRWNSVVFSPLRPRFYFLWNLSRNGSSKKFHETNHVTQCNVCWNMFRSAVTHKFLLKFSTCNGGFIIRPPLKRKLRMFLLCFVALKHTNIHHE